MLRPLRAAPFEIGIVPANGWRAGRDNLKGFLPGNLVAPEDRRTKDSMMGQWKKEKKFGQKLKLN